MKKVVVIGGGTGTYTVLSGLRNYPLEISAVVSMMDSGGSSGRLRDQLEVLPPGDFRQCLVALSNAPDVWRKLFLYRFESGDLKGHNFGNLFLSALEKISPSYKEVVKTASQILSTSGSVIPVTTEKTTLCVEYEDGEIYKSEGLIDKLTKSGCRVKQAFLEPEVSITQEAEEAIKKADFIVIGPGDVYTSLVPNLVVGGVQNHIKNSSAMVLYIVNLMTKLGQTDGYKASDHVLDIEKYIGKSIDMVLVNSTPIPHSSLNHYQSEGGKQVVDDLADGHRVIRCDLLADSVFEKAPVDTAVRSLVRHDSNKLASAVYQVISSQGGLGDKVSDVFKTALKFISE